MSNFPNVWRGYRNMWNSMQIRSAEADDLRDIAERLLKHKSRYKAVEAQTAVPWELIAAIGEREAGTGIFKGHLHNGDPLTGYTYHKPSGRPHVGHGPPFTWEESAADALKYDGLTEVNYWTIERMLFEAEGYNGWGYYKKNVNSPYVWSFSNHYTRGKYVADGEYDPHATDAQAGVAPILYMLQQFDPSIEFRREGEDLVA